MIKVIKINNFDELLEIQKDYDKHIENDKRSLKDSIECQRFREMYNKSLIEDETPVIPIKAKKIMFNGEEYSKFMNREYDRKLVEFIMLLHYGKEDFHKYIDEIRTRFIFNTNFDMSDFLDYLSCVYKNEIEHSPELHDKNKLKPFIIEKLIGYLVHYE